jgi:isocitrate dehydrogenase
MYWAEELAKQTENTSLSNQFKPIAQALTDNEALIIDELNQAQGPKQDLGGYYHLDTQKATQAMRPSATLNNIIQSITQ